MKYLREVDDTLIIHHQQDTTLHNLSHQTIPLAARAKLYADMTEQQNRQRTQAKFTCVTIIANTRTLEELKQRDPLFIQTLNKLKVYI